MEGAMNAINWDLQILTVQTHSGLRWADIKRQLWSGSTRTRQNAN
jgi:hypothetical protein